jgi:tetratricopeptide (TPR) repeat protein
VLVLGTYRNTDLDPNAPFSRTLQDLIRQRLVDEITLERLTPDEVASIFEGRSEQRPPEELVRLVYAETEGNAFFVEELYRHLEESGKLLDATGKFRSGIELADIDVPSGVRLTIEHRLAKVSDNCRKLLTAAAIAGRQTSYELLTEIGGLTGDDLLDALEESEAAALMEDISVGREARYQFVHELIRQTLISTLSLPRRQRLHMLVAHLYQAGAAADGERTINYLLTASERALGSAAFEDAIRYLDMADEAVATSDNEYRARICGVRAEALRGAARIEEALQALGHGLEMGADMECYPQLLLQRGSLLVDLYRGGEALPDLQALLQIAQATGDRPLEIEAQRRLSDAHYRLSLDIPEHAEQAVEACRRTIDIAREAGDQKTLARALIDSTHFVDYWPDFRPEAARNLNEARDIVSKLGDEDLELECGTMAVRAALFDTLEFEVDSEEVAARLEARRDPIRLKEHYFWMIATTRNEGRLERSVEVCERAIELAARLDVPPVQYPTFKALALIPLGRFGEAWQSIGEEVTGEGYRFAQALQQMGFFRFKCHMSAIDELFAEAGPVLRESQALNRAWMIEMAADDFLAAAAKASRHKDALREIDAAIGVYKPGGLAQGEIALADGAPEDALDFARNYLELVDQRGWKFLAAEARVLIARCDALLERYDEAEREIEAVMQFCADSGARNLEWQGLAIRSAIRSGRGDATGAATDHSAAEALMEELAESIPSPELRQAYLHQPLINSVQVLGGE